MRYFRKTSYSVYLPDGTRCKGAYYPGDTELVGIHVHGFRSSVDNTKARYFLEQALDKRYSWSNFDLPCHGRSEGRFREFRVSTALTAVVEVIQQFRGSPIMLFGSSIGAWLSMLAARKLAKSPDITIAGAILVAPAFDFIHHYFANENAGELDRWRQQGVRRFFDRFDGQPYDLDYAFYEDGLRQGLLERPGDYNFPIRIFHGNRDQIVPLSLSQRFKAMSPASDITLTVIEQGDHSLNQHLPLISAEMDEMFEDYRIPKAV